MLVSVPTEAKWVRVVVGKEVRVGVQGQVQG